MIRSPVAALVLLGFLTPGSAEAKCARTEHRPKILTTRDTNIPDDGGVMVGWTSEVYSDEDDHPVGDPSDQPTWTATDGKKPVALARVSLAPGLSVYRPAHGTGKIIVKSKAGATLGTFAHDPKAAANTMASPQVIGVALSTDKAMRWSERHAMTKLKVAPPVAAIALITYRVTAKGNEPISFVTIADTHDTLTSLDAFQDAGHCGGVVGGSAPPNAGDKVVFAWVDAFGRLSPVSAPVTAK